MTYFHFDGFRLTSPLNRDNMLITSSDYGFRFCVSSIPSPKSQSPKKEPASKARRSMLNPDAPPDANQAAGTTTSLSRNIQRGRRFP